MTRTVTWQTRTTALSSTFVGHDARNGFCPICGAVAPCYRARRARVQTSGA
jgi:hypothetical protein